MPVTSKLKRRMSGAKISEEREAKSALESLASPFQNEELEVLMEMVDT